MPRSRMMASGLLPSVGGAGSLTWASYVASLNPAAWYRQMQTTANEPNQGSLGSAVDMTITSTTLGQTGILGTNNAYLYDGANSRLQTPNNATLAAFTKFEYVFLVSPSSAGEGSLGAFFYWGNGGSGNNIALYLSVSQLGMRVNNTTPTTFATVTTTAPANNTWQILFFAYDDAGDRLCHIYKGVSGTVSEFAYSAQPALTGTFKSQTQALNLFNNSAQGQTFAGLADEVMIFNGNLTPAQRTQLTLLAGV